MYEALRNLAITTAIMYASLQSALTINEWMRQSECYTATTIQSSGTTEVTTCYVPAPHMVDPR